VLLSRLSTTVDADLLSSARPMRTGWKDHALFDEALAALLAGHRAVDATYRAYDDLPADQPDAWGPL
jgi:hypothetical protein